MPGHCESPASSSARSRRTSPTAKDSCRRPVGSPSSSSSDHRSTNPSGPSTCPTRSSRPSPSTFAGTPGRATPPGGCSTRAVGPGTTSSSTTDGDRPLPTPALNSKLHDLRHYFASGLIVAGCDVVTVQRAMGHASRRPPWTRTHTSGRPWRTGLERPPPRWRRMFLPQVVWRSPVRRGSPGTCDWGPPAGAGTAWFPGPGSWCRCSAASRCSGPPGCSELTRITTGVAAAAAETSRTVSDPRTGQMAATTAAAMRDNTNPRGCRGAGWSAPFLGAAFAQTGCAEPLSGQARPTPTPTTVAVRSDQNVCPVQRVAERSGGWSAGSVSRLAARGQSATSAVS